MPACQAAADSGRQSDPTFLFYLLYNVPSRVHRTYADKLYRAAEKTGATRKADKRALDELVGWFQPDHFKGAPEWATEDWTVKQGTRLVLSTDSQGAVVGESEPD